MKYRIIIETKKELTLKEIKFLGSKLKNLPYIIDGNIRIEEK
jgi:hypothetical protein